ncbi:Endo-1-3(4)-beta-glucanase [Penicillium samsonianum]|uniref:Endo-1-3(4)-beta-glucanase n=1 Tax=Penicillium samsonianum TaxID=1882272 RepID=UPI002546D8C8|nr:Endo-1-3(4)-beta-glucanase [Penicillium samsonianum]KAJ6143993.1 Endo-1-3(4)-beta-glucanase [Penicillium samsonianum]
MTNYGDTWSTAYDTYNTAGSTYSPTGYNTYGTRDYGAGGVGYGSNTTATTYDTDTGRGTTTYDPATGAYDQHLDYSTPTGHRHHRERVNSSGTYRHRDVDRFDDGSTRVHKEYDNPNTGTSYHRDYER